MVKSEIREMRARHTDDIRRAFARPLAARLGRPMEEILSKRLQAFDFPGNDLELTLPDGSTMAFHYAFFVHDEAQGAVGVFTEHCGYHCFAASDLELRVIEDGVIVEQHRW